MRLLTLRSFGIVVVFSFGVALAALSCSPMYESPPEDTGPIVGKDVLLMDNSPTHEVVCVCKCGTGTEKHKVPAGGCSTLDKVECTNPEGGTAHLSSCKKKSEPIAQSLINVGDLPVLKQ